MMARANGKVMLRNLSRQFERIMELLLMACSVKLEAQIVIVSNGPAGWVVRRRFCAA